MEWMWRDAIQTPVPGEHLKSSTSPFQTNHIRTCVQIQGVMQYAIKHTQGKWSTDVVGCDPKDWFQSRHLGQPGLGIQNMLPVLHGINRGVHQRKVTLLNFLRLDTRIPSINSLSLFPSLSFKAQLVFSPFTNAQKLRKVMVYFKLLENFDSILKRLICSN